MVRVRVRVSIRVRVRVRVRVRGGEGYALSEAERVVEVEEVRTARFEVRVAEGQVYVAARKGHREVRGGRVVPAEARVQMAHVVARGVAPRLVDVNRRSDRPAHHQRDHHELVRRDEVVLGVDNQSGDLREGTWQCR